MYLIYTGIDKFRGLRRGQVYEVEFKAGLDRLTVEVIQHRKTVTGVEYYGVGTFKNDWIDPTDAGKKENGNES